MPSDHITPSSASEVTLPSPFLSDILLMRMLQIAFRSHLNNPEDPHLKSLNLITSAEFLPYRATFTNSRIMGEALGPLL